MRFMKLDLRSPLYYEKPVPTLTNCLAAHNNEVPIQPTPEAFTKDFFEAAAELDECLALFGLEPSSAVSLSPDPVNYLQLPTAFGASSIHQTMVNETKVGTRLALPNGLYLFLQVAGAASLNQLVEEAIELQKEGIWNGESLSPILYLRVLSEEQGLVHQLLRPMVGKARGT